MTDASANESTDEQPQSAGQNHSIDVEIASRTRVRLSSAEVHLPDLLQSIGLGDAPVADVRSTSTRPLFHISVSRRLRPDQAHAKRVREDLLIEPSVLWLLEPSGSAGMGLEFGSWNGEINAAATPQRVGSLIRLLLPIALPSHGLLPGHGAAYQTAHGLGIVVSGLPNSGKTGATLAAVAGGGKFLADDLVIIDPELGALYGTALPVTVAYSYLQRYPQFQARVPGKTVASLRLKNTLLAGSRRFLPPTLVNRLFPRRLSKRWTNFLNTRVTTELTRNTLFSPDQIADTANLDQLTVLTAAANGEGSATEASRSETNTRWLLAVHKETTELRNLYSLYRYTYPDTSCQLLDNYTATLEKLIAKIGSRCTRRAVVVDWQQPNPELIRSGIEESVTGD